MNLKLFALIASFISISPTFCSDPNPIDPPRTYTALSIMMNPFSLILDVVAVPLSYFSIGDTSHIESQKIVVQAMELAADPLSDEVKLRQASELLNTCAIEGNPSALYHVGRLMLHRPELQFESVLKYFEPDELMGITYLKEAKKKGVEKAQEVLEEEQGIKFLNRAFIRAHGLEAGPPNIDKARGLLKFAVKKKSPHAACFLAEAILKLAEPDNAWVYDEDKGYYERRIMAIPLLEFASSRHIPKARDLMEALEIEDRFYEEVCRMILEDGDKVISGLKLGNAGFQQAYIHMICEQEIRILGNVLKPEYGLYLIQAMTMRVNLVYQFLSDYSQYIGEENRILVNMSKNPLNKEKALSLIVDYVVGRKAVTIPLLKDSKECGPKVYIFNTHGLLCPVTMLDANTAYRKIVHLDDDFNEEE